MKSLSFTYIQSSSHPLSHLALLPCPGLLQADQDVVVGTGLLHNVHGEDPVAELLEGLHHHVAQPPLTSVYENLAGHVETETFLSSRNKYKPVTRRFYRRLHKVARY